MFAFIVQLSTPQMFAFILQLSNQQMFAQVKEEEKKESKKIETSIPAKIEIDSKEVEEGNLEDFSIFIQ